MTVAALASPVALFTASLLASSRVPFVLAERRFLPAPFVSLHPKFGTPWVAILFSSVVFVVLAYKDFTELVVLNVTMYGAALVLETTALLVLRKKEPDLHRPFKIPGGWPVLWLVWALPVSMVALLVVLDTMEMGLATQGLTVAGLVSGPVVYVLVKALRRPEPAGAERD
jgi:amino acid transporter